MVTVHGSLKPKSVSGFRMTLVAVPPTVAVCSPVVVQEIWNHEPVRFTGSSKLIVMLVSTGMCVSLFAGDVANISGSKSPTGQTVAVVEVLRGYGDPRSEERRVGKECR